MKLLIDSKADVNMKSSNGTTAWALAGVAGDANIIDILKKAGADNPQKQAGSKKQD